MRSQIILIFILVLSLLTCDQTPTTLYEEPYIEPAETDTLILEIVSFEFDILTWNFFFSVAAESPDDSIEVEAELLVAGQTAAHFSLKDSGVGSDIQVNDGSYDENWLLPDSMSNFIDSLWTLSIHASSNGETKIVSQAYQPEPLITPIIASISHSDTLIRPITGQIRDTTQVEIIYPRGRDSMRDVRFTSLKPDGTWANNGLPIPMYDDGGERIYSGDKVAGDGIYSLILPLEPSHLIGTYYWTFQARTWLGIEAGQVEDSLIVITAPEVLRGLPVDRNLMEVLQ